MSELTQPTPRTATEPNETVTELETTLRPDNPVIAERVSVIRKHLDAYQQASFRVERRDRLNAAESELQLVRIALEDGEVSCLARAQTLVDRIERQLANRR